MITLFFFTLTFLLEAVTAIDGKERLFFYLLVPSIYFIEKKIKKEKIYQEKKILFIYILFILFSFISFLKSVDKINTINQLFLYFTGFLFFFIGYNEKKVLAFYFKKILILFSIVFSFLSFLPQTFFKPIALQLIFPLYPNHNHLGDFLGMTLIFLIYDYFKNKRKNDIFLFFLFLPFFLFSFSRSAYVDLLIILFLIIIKEFSFKRYKKFIFSLLILLIIFFIFTQKELYQIKPFSYFCVIINQKLNFQPRSIFSERPEYFSQAIKGFLEKPFFGWGLGNFIYPSQKYVIENLQQVTTSLNLFLTLLTELGIFGFLTFLIFLFFILKNIDFNFSPLHYIFIYLILNFLTDYTYLIYGLFLLWFLLAGVIFKKKDNEFIFFPLLSFLVLFFVLLKITSGFFNNFGLFEFSLKIFPFNHQTFQILINKKKDQGKLNEAFKLVQDYERKSSLSFESLNFLGDFYYYLDKKNEALRLYQKITDNNLFPPFDVLIKVYKLKKEDQGKKIADDYFLSFFNNFKTSFWLNRSLEDDVYKFCFQENISFCRFRYFYRPKPKTIEKSRKDLPIKAVYIFNNEGFNERFDYSIKKSKNTFRILVLGDANAFGFLVNTADNWVEKLEDKFKTQKSKLKIKYNNVEVINLSYHSYDLAYAIERFRLQGIKYKPDLIIFMNSNFYRINEIFLPLVRKYSYLEINFHEKEKLRKEGKYFPSWDLAWEEYLKKVKKKEVYQKQKEYLEEFFSLYKGKVLFISFYYIPYEIKSFLNLQNDVEIIENLNPPKDKDYYYKAFPNIINKKGHEKLAEKILNYFKINLKIKNFFNH